MDRGSLLAHWHIGKLINYLFCSLNAFNPFSRNCIYFDTSSLNAYDGPSGLPSSFSRM